MNFIELVDNPTEYVYTPKDGNKATSQNNMHRSFNKRHIYMLAISTIIGNGLFISSGASLAKAGPLGSFIAMIISGISVYFVFSCVTEMSTFIPIPGSFNSFADRFVDPSFGFAMGYNYWYKWVISTSNNILSSGIVISFWVKDAPEFIWGAIVLITIVYLNTGSSKIFSEAIYSITVIKVIAIYVFIGISILEFSGALGGKSVGLSNLTIDEAPFVNGIEGFCRAFVMSGYMFQGCEIIGVTAGESENPSRDIPKAAKAIFWQTSMMIILSFAFICLIVPYNDPGLFNTKDKADSVSPFILVLLKANIDSAPNIMNAVILITTISSGACGLYISSRTLYSLAIEKKVSKLFTKLSKNKIPIYCIGLNVFISIILYSFKFIGSNVLYYWFISFSSVSGYIAWIGILYSYWRYKRAYRVQGYSEVDLPHVAALYPFGPAFSFFLLIIIVLAQGMRAFTDDELNTVNILIKSYIGIPIFLFFWLGYKFLYKSKLIPLKYIDLETDNYMNLGFGNYRHIKKSNTEIFLDVFF
ncbi:hypothetical protein BB561_003006 [Smittium simulii]|uniref:Amino acid permease/ SLC12A domain-containing protein n=1 Tax=Smittium simulii TaxID=133385 RepID=A0A2T9YNC9_9FUNG|nr:hypothetical protein BB561_003006 [Smittium simulii]